MRALPPILPIGTAIVTRSAICNSKGEPIHPAGTAGIIIHSPSDPDHTYRVRFPAGDDASLSRDAMHVLSHYQRGEIDTDPLNEHDLHRHVILRCIIGSRAYGLEHDASDIDRRGIYLPPASLQWSLYGVPEQLEHDATQEVYWELGKFLRLALKANPNVLEVLHSPLIEHATPLAEELLAMRRGFVTKLVYQTYNGYAMSQFHKLGQDLRNKGQIKWKHAMHLIRLLLSGIAAMQTGDVPVRVADEHRASLLAIRDGQMPWRDVDTWRQSLHVEFEKAYAATQLPDWPDYDAANRFLIKARRTALDLT